jgi:hypothetical protein
VKCNLTSAFVKAMLSPITADTQASTYRLAIHELVKLIPNAVVDVDFETLEAWVEINSTQPELFYQDAVNPWSVVLDQNKRIAYFRNDIPLIIILETYSTIVQSFLASHEISVVYASDFSSRSFCIDLPILECLPANSNPKFHWTSSLDVIDPSQLSIDELYWSTLYFLEIDDQSYDLTNDFTSATGRMQKYSNELFNLLLVEIFGLESNLASNWEKGSEDWVIISSSNHLMLIIHAYLPLIFVKEDFLHKVQPIVTAFSLVAISVKCFESKKYILNAKKVALTLPDWNWPSSYNQSFSILDLVYATM